MRGFNNPTGRSKACKGCGSDFVPPTFRQRYCDACRGQCSVEGCKSAVKAHSLCGMHLWRLNTHGATGTGAYINEPQKGNVCKCEGCELPAETRGFCNTHYSRYRIHGTPGAAATRTTKPTKVPCEVVGCTRLAIGNGLCRMHYERVRNSRDVGSPDAMRAASGSGHLHKTGYRTITVDGKVVLEHRRIMENMLGRPLLKNESVHHKNGQRAFNAPNNLELWSKAQPAGQRVADKIQFIIEMAKAYPEFLRAAGYELNPVTHINDDSENREALPPPSGQ